MDRPKWSIAGLMWIIFVVAVALVAAREWGSHVSRPGEGLVLLLAAGLLLALAAQPLFWIWFVLVPRWSMKLAGGDAERQASILRWVINTPFPSRGKLLARFLLAVNDHFAGHYDDAESGFRSILRATRRGMDLPPGLESMLRQHLADVLETLGRPMEAAAEREQAAATLDDEEDQESPLGLRARGQWLDHEHRYSEAIQVYERALALVPPGDKDMQTGLMMSLLLGTSNAGQPADTLRWAESIIEADPDGPTKRNARQMAAEACDRLGRLDDAERYARIDLETARTAKERAGALNILGECRMRRGELDEAERMVREADAISGGRDQVPWIILGMIEGERGRLEAAIQTLDHARTIPAGRTPAVDRRTNAMIDRLLAIFHADLGHRDLAMERIVGAEVLRADGPRHAVALDASAALVYAFIGQRDAALARMESADRDRHDFPQDLSIQRAVLSFVGYAALALDDPERAEILLRALLDLRPEPISLPSAWYHLGGCRRRLGDESGGRDCDARAASTRFGSRWERLARERLAAEGITA